MFEKEISALRSNSWLLCYSPKHCLALIGVTQAVAPPIYPSIICVSVGNESGEAKGHAQWRFDQLVAGDVSE